MAPITHILFDFFGTLVEYSDSRAEQGYEQTHAFLLANGATLSYPEFITTSNATWHRFDLEAEASQDEHSMEDVGAVLKTEILGPDADPALVPVFMDTFLWEWNKGVRYIDGVPKLLAQLSERYTLALVTNTNSAKIIRHHLGAMGIADQFSAVVTSVEHGKRKPHPSIFEEALNRTAGRSENAIYVGDTYSADYVGANAAGMRCLLIDPAKRHTIADADRICHVLEVRRIV